MKISCVIFLWVHCAFYARAQSVSTLMGSRAAGMGYASAVLSDAWALMNNPGGLAGNSSGSVAAAQEIHPGVEGAGRTALVGCAPVVGGVGSVALFRFGDAVYNEQVVAIGYGNRMGIASLGVRASYVQYHAEGFQNRNAFALALGGIAKLTPMLSVGAYAENLNQPILSKSDQEHLPVRLTAALGFQPTDNFLFTAEIMKDLDYRAVCKAGVELSVHRQVVVRSGFNLHPNSYFLGFGMKARSIKIDYALQLNTFVGMVHQASVIYRHTRNTKAK